MEIEVKTNRNNVKKGDFYQCNRCNALIKARADKIRVCGKCHNAYWDKKRKRMIK